MKKTFLFFSFLFFSLTYSYSQCAFPPSQCLLNWNPSPCSSCVVDCGPCTFYFYCGSSLEDEECFIYTRCSDQSSVKITDSSNTVYGSSVVFGGCSQTYVSSVPQGFMGNLTLSVFKPGTQNLLCRTNYYFNCN